MQQTQQAFSLSDLTGDDIQALMNGLNELPAKVSRVTMNKVESQIIAQLQAAQMSPSKEQSVKKAED